MGLLSLRDLRRHGRAILMALAVFLVWFAGLRFFVGCDYHSYVLRFEEAVTMPWSRVFADDERGFGLLTAIFAKAGASFAMFQAFATMVIIACYAKFVARYPNPIYLFTLFFPILVLQLGMSGLRQAMALAFVLLALNAFVDGKRLLVGIWIIVAFQFHNSAIVLLPLAFVAGRAVSFKQLAIGMALLAPVAAFLLGDRIEVYSDRYVDQIYGEQESSGAWFRYILVLLPLPLFLRYRRKIKFEYSKLYPLLTISALFIIAVSSTALISSVALHRLTYYALPLSILMTLYTSLVAFRDPVRGHIAWMGLYGGYMLSWFVLSRHATVCYQPYQNFWFSDLVVPDWAYVF